MPGNHKAQLKSISQSVYMLQGWTFIFIQRRSISLSFSLTASQLLGIPLLISVYFSSSLEVLLYARGCYSTPEHVGNYCHFPVVVSCKLRCRLSEQPWISVSVFTFYFPHNLFHFLNILSQVTF